MKIDRINPPDVLVHPRFSRIVALAGEVDLVFFSSQAPYSDGPLPEELRDLRAQYIFVMDELSKKLAAAGCSWNDVVVRRLLLTDIDDFYAMRAADPNFPYYFEELPTSTALQVTSLLHPDWMIEVEIVAAVRS